MQALFAIARFEPRTSVFKRSAMFMSSYNVRKKYIDFFQLVHGHEFVQSSSVRIHEDETLLFVNAGMNQFKSKFLGTIHPGDKMASVKRAVNSQKCIRVGGKHNDLEDVGKDNTHHTFFEMLGSWSFGDYFKDRSCEMALSLLTEHYGLSIDQLYFTYFAGNANLAADSETYNIWKALGIPESKIIAFEAKDNFWEMGDVGPCGPCTEIHYDYGKKHRNAAELVNKGHPDVVEIWNLVFMQYNRLSDKSLVSLPTYHVDTGMGLERITAILQEKQSNYDTDLFIPLIRQTEEVCNCPKYSGGSSPIDQAYRTIADHIRMLVVAIGDNVYPGNTAEELIVRQVLRRAYLQSKKILGAPDGLLKLLCTVVISSLSSHFTYLHDKQNEIERVIDDEEQKFSEILSRGEKMFSSTMTRLKDSNFPVETAILMYNHFGYPIDLLIDAIKENDLKLNMEEFTKYQESRELLKQSGREKDKGNSKRIDITAHVIENLRKHNLPVTDGRAKYAFTRTEDGQYIFPTTHSTLRAIVDSAGNLKDKIESGQQYALVFDSTCFYHADGGQKSDTGKISQQQTECFNVDDVSDGGGYIFHHGSGSGLKLGDAVTLKINCRRRLAFMRAHTATHLLNHALREVFGKSISQHGSRVSEDETTFTFLGPTPSHSDLANILTAVRNHIEQGSEIKTHCANLEEALNDSNVRRLQDGAYTNPVRLVSVGTSIDNSHSAELCGGTHVKSTADIGQFEIVSSKSQGKHRTTLRCFTSSHANDSIALLHELKTKVQEMVNKSEEMLSDNSATLDDCFSMRKDIGRTNYRVNQSVISVIYKAEMKENLRKHSQKLGTKIRTLQKAEHPQLRQHKN